MQTTVRCTLSEKSLVEETAFKQGTDVSRFISHALKKNLPLKEVPIFDKNIDRSKHRLGVVISSDIAELINNSKDELTTDLKRVFKWEIILFCALKECEG